MKFISYPQRGSIPTLELSRFNLETLLAKLDMEGSVRTLIDPNERIAVKAVENSEHYAERAPGPVLLPDGIEDEGAVAADGSLGAKVASLEAEVAVLRLRDARAQTAVNWAGAYENCVVTRRKCYEEKRALQKQVEAQARKLDELRGWANDLMTTAPLRERISARVVLTILDTEEIS